jgi:hypothetical protein
MLSPHGKLKTSKPVSLEQPTTTLTTQKPQKNGPQMSLLLPDLPKHPKLKLISTTIFGNKELSLIFKRENPTRLLIKLLVIWSRKTQVLRKSSHLMLI